MTERRAIMYWFNARKLKQRYWKPAHGFVKITAARRYAMWHKKSVRARMALKA